MSDPEAEQLLARALEAFGQAEFDDARALLERLLSTRPDHAQAWGTLGICHLETGRPQQGLEALERAVEADPTNADYHYWLGNAAGTLGQLDRAYACYQRALELDPKHVKAGDFLVRTRNLPDDLRRALDGGLETDAQRALQFVRSTPGVGAALVGMSHLPHVEENLRLVEKPLVPADTFRRLFVRKPDAGKPDTGEPDAGE